MDKHLEGLTEVQKRLVKAYATLVMGNARTLDEVKPADLRHYVELEIAEREVAILSNY